LTAIPTGRYYGTNWSVYQLQTIEIKNESKTRILDAALRVIRTKGYAATRVEDICEAAGLTKGGFFHHFKSKEELAISAVEYFSQKAESLYSNASYRKLADPLERLLGYVEFRKSILEGELPDYTCLIGTMVQETYETHPNIRKVCERSISTHTATLVSDIEAAIRKYGVSPQWTARSLAYYTQSVIQGALILAKAQHGPDVAVSSLDHLRRYLKLIFYRS
jgi:TetR/AcrR family transcriptional repressor of nem operon